MRLIDAEPIEKSIAEWKARETNEPLTKTIVDNVGTWVTHAPTADAVPIDYIENWLKELRKSLRNVQMSIPDYNDTMNKLDEFERVIHMMIYNWREENEIN